MHFFYCVSFRSVNDTIRLVKNEVKQVIIQMVKLNDFVWKKNLFLDFIFSMRDFLMSGCGLNVMGSTRFRQKGVDVFRSFGWGAHQAPRAAAALVLLSFLAYSREVSCCAHLCVSSEKSCLLLGQDGRLLNVFFFCVWFWEKTLEWSVCYGNKKRGSLTCSSCCCCRPGQCPLPFHPPGFLD